MAEMLVMAYDKTHPDPTKSRAEFYKKGYPVVIKEDGHPGWGLKERLPWFYVIKFPKIPKAKLEKYLYPQITDNDPKLPYYRQRLWKIRIDDMAQGLKEKLDADGEITVKATDSVLTAYDETWTNMKSFFRNQETNIDEKQDL